MPLRLPDIDRFEHSFHRGETLEIGSKWVNCSLNPLLTGFVGREKIAVHEIAKTDDKVTHNHASDVGVFLAVV